jgi:hypothetical protein
MTKSTVHVYEVCCTYSKQPLMQKVPSVKTVVHSSLNMVLTSLDWFKFEIYALWFTTLNRLIMILGSNRPWFCSIIITCFQDEHDCVPEQVHRQNHHGQLQSLHLNDRYPQKQNIIHSISVALAEYGNQKVKRVEYRRAQVVKSGNVDWGGKKEGCPEGCGDIYFII